MIAKKLTYLKWSGIAAEINGHAVRQENGEVTTLLVGLKNEDVTQGIALRLSKIIKKIQEEFKELQTQLDLNQGEEGAEKRAELWAEECEISFEGIDLNKIEDLKRKDNSFGEKYDYSNLLDVIS